MHRHGIQRSQQRPFTGSVPSSHPDPGAHGNITIKDECRCGAVRLTNVNGTHIERGHWWIDSAPPRKER